MSTALTLPSKGIVIVPTVRLLPDRLRPAGQGDMVRQNPLVVQKSLRRNGFSGAMRILCRKVAGREVPAAVAFDRKRGQHAGAIRAGVDADPVGPLVDALENRMAVDDDAAMVVRVAEEWVANPPEVGAVLLFDGDAGADAGVDEQIVAEREGVAEAFEEVAMLARHLGAEQRDRLLVLDAAQQVRIDAVARRTFGAAELQPIGKEAGVAAEDGKEHLLMVAGEEDGADMLRPPFAQPLDHPRRRGAAVDEIAQEDDPRLARWARRDVLFDPCQQVVEQVEPAVYVADRIRAGARLAARHLAAAAYDPLQETHDVNAYSAAAPRRPAAIERKMPPSSHNSGEREKLPRVHDPLGIERLLDRPQRLEPRGRIGARQSRRLHLADAVLGRDRTAGGDDEVVDETARFLAARLEPSWHRRRLDVEVDIAVAEMAEGDGARAGIACLDGACRLDDEFGHRRDRHRDVVLEARPLPALRFRDRVAQLPQRLRLRLAGGKEGVRRLAILQRRTQCGFQRRAGVGGVRGRDSLDEDVPRLGRFERRAGARDV